MRHRILILFLLFSLSAFAKTWTVAQKGTLKTIKAALQVAATGDTILVRSGTYKEGNLIIKKTLTMIGVGLPTIDGENKYELFTITADHVTISGFRLINTGVASIEDVAAIKAIEVDALKIINNQFENTFFGIHLSNSTNCLVRGNTLKSNAKAEHQIGNGIHAWKCDHITIEDNNVSGHRDGIYFEFVTHSLVRKNFSHENMRYGLHFMFSHNDDYLDNVFKNNGAGVAVMYTKDVKMIGNRFEENEGSSSYGLLLKDIRDSKIEKNIFSKNTIAVYMEGTSRCQFMKNEFIENGWAIKLQASCDDNTLIENNFRSNTFDIATNGSISLNVISKNYWDKYDGYDLNRDGIGDVPFHPVSLYGMIVEKMPAAVMLWRSFLVFLLDRAKQRIDLRE